MFWMDSHIISMTPQVTWGLSELMVYDGEMVGRSYFDSELDLQSSGRDCSYVDDYVFTVRSATFSSEEGKTVVRSYKKRSALSYL